MMEMEVGGKFLWIYKRLLGGSLSCNFHSLKPESVGFVIMIHSTVIWAKAKTSRLYGELISASPSK